jgi:hypothetical protein
MRPEAEADGPKSHRAKVKNDLDPHGGPSAHAQSPPLSCRP